MSNDDDDRRAADEKWGARTAPATANEHIEYDALLEQAAEERGREGGTISHAVYTFN